MPVIEISTAERREVDDAVLLVKHFMRDLPRESRFVFALELLRTFDPEIQELRRRAAAIKEHVRELHTTAYCPLPTAE